MRWEGGGESSNVEDRRSMKPALAAAGGGIGGLLLMAVVYFVTGDANVAKQAGQIVQQRQAQNQGQGQGKAEPINDKTYKFSRAVLKSTEDVWNEQFRLMGQKYEEPQLILFTERVQSGCGVAPAAVGPFYCPVDHKLYYDPTFFDELEQKLGGSKAEFSQAYVIAHEVGHHVQTLLGYGKLGDRFQEREGKNGTIRTELQADYLAGAWAHHGEKKSKFLDPGDLNEALKTAKAIGDNRIAEKSRGWVSPESFTHGSDAQRIKYFRQGFETGDVSKPKLDSFFNPNVKPLDL